MSGVLVFGGSGFIGSHLINKLVESNISSIISVDIKPPKVNVDGVTYINADVRDLSAFSLNGKIISTIYNFAAIHTTPGHEHHEYYETNILGANEITKFAENNGINEIIFTSSISVYGAGESRKTEASTPTPVSSYGFSKMMAEQIHKAWHERNKSSKLIIVRPAVVFGPGEGGNFTRLASLLDKGFFIYPGRKDTIKSCIYVDDLLYAIEHARNKNTHFVLFNGAYTTRYTLENIVNAFQDQHFQNVKTMLFPKSVMLAGASLLKAVNFLDIGIHPERILKLINSTDVYPQWLEDEGLLFDNGLKNALAKWAQDTNGSFK
ncbi:NAD(P)-dependent oxidoreductase [Pseudoalteromonas sp. SR43-2]|uniref:NAD-dependent epimerase/dehydratase family protein n=1 Tax=Pseudoalteromonas sp. SR43-2 TaxID=2760944 RepID=UPI0015F7A5AC|nr:NAD-dependent epimerase/dehydratase family protein [Pseudoalteromonas sp. SR43-2]MBB1379353.1 NAD-dependent epimerase/dehydratase family protein [Pseudoalteromonas sp. SR43-2]